MEPLIEKELAAKNVVEQVIENVAELKNLFGQKLFAEN